jgi:cation-transporting P-type ATPase C
MPSLKLATAKQQEGNEWIDELLDAVSVRFATQGRIRFHLAFKADEVLADSIRREVQKLETAKLESFSERTKNVLVTFDPAKTSEIAVTTALLKGIKEFARLHGECDLDHHHHGAFGAHEHGEKCDHDHSATATDAGIRKELLKLVATGGVLGYFVYRKLKGSPIAFAGNPLLDVAALVTVISGYSIFRAGVDSVQKQRKATDDTLISIAVIATLLMGESITGLSVVWLINLGRLLEAITLKRSRTAIKDLMDIAPPEGWVVTKKGNKEVVKRTPVEKIRKGQILRIFQDEKVPLDGKVLDGRALVKEAFLTGESLPREKAPGESVYAGSLLAQGSIDIEVTNLVHDTVVARMIDAIENVRYKKAPIEKIGTRFASKFVPVSIGLATVILLVTGDLRRAITMLVIACPCAAGLATPTAVSASIGQAARRGILIKGGTHVEMAAKIDTVIFDKTGTLTLGEPHLTHFVPTSLGKKLGEEKCLQLAASAEQYTTHPLGLALVQEAKKREIELCPVKSHKTHPGLGVSALLGDKQIHIGNRHFMEQCKIEGDIDTEGRRFATGESLLYFAVDEKLCGLFTVQDKLRPEAHEALERLKKLGVKRILLASGDQKLTAEHIAKEVGIKEVHAELLPADKLALVAKLKKSGARVAMVGDGINDAQALTEAHLSIAMGGGHCDIAIETADVTLAKNDLLLIADTLDISQRTLRTIYQNFIAAVGINSGGLLISTFGTLTPFSAAIVHNASTIVVVLNSLRLGREIAPASLLKMIKEVKV